MKENCRCTERRKRMAEKRINTGSRLLLIVTWIGILVLNPLSLFIEVVFLCRYDAAFMWHAYEFLRGHAVEATTICFWIFIAILIFRCREHLE